MGDSHVEAGRQVHDHAGTRAGGNDSEGARRRLAWLSRRALRQGGDTKRAPRQSVREAAKQPEIADEPRPSSGFATAVSGGLPGALAAPTKVVGGDKSLR